MPASRENGYSSRKQLDRGEVTGDPAFPLGSLGLKRRRSRCAALAGTSLRRRLALPSRARANTFPPRRAHDGKPPLEAYIFNGGDAEGLQQLETTIQRSSAGANAVPLTNFQGSTLHIIGHLPELSQRRSVIVSSPRLKLSNHTVGGYQCTSVPWRLQFYLQHLSGPLKRLTLKQIRSPVPPLPARRKATA